MMLEGFEARQLRRVEGLVRPSVVGLCLVLVLVLLNAGVAAKGDGPSPVTLAEASTETLRESVSLSGTAIPSRRVMLTPRVDGLVSEVMVDAGSWVEPGDPVLALDDRLAAIDVRAAKARLQQAEATLADAIRVRDELLRLRQGRHASATSIDSSVAQVEIQQAAVARQRAEVERAQELRKRHAVFAPFAGMIIEKRVETGQWVKQDLAVVELVAVDTLRIRVPLPQRWFSRVPVGARATLLFDALPGHEVEGSVFARVASGNASSRSFPLLIDIPNPDRQLAPGMSARILVELSGGDGDGEAVTVPRDALVTKVDGSRQVWRVREDDGVLKAHPVTVETGRAQGDRVEVLNGALRSGDRVVLLGNENLRPGQAVSPQIDKPVAAAD